MNGSNARSSSLSKIKAGQPPNITIRAQDGRTLTLDEVEPATRKKIMDAHRAAAMSVPERIFALGEEGMTKLRQEYVADAGKWGSAFTGVGVAVNSPLIEGLSTNEAKEKLTAELERLGTGHGAVTYKLRDWLFSRQRYWGEPFPIVLDPRGKPYALPETELPVALPELTDFKPTGTPEPPLSKAKDWIRYSPAMTRETNTMPQWAGSCWYYLRYIDPKNEASTGRSGEGKILDAVDLYVGGVEHACCICSTQDSGIRCCSTSGSFRRRNRSSGS